MSHFSTCVCSTYLLYVFMSVCLIKRLYMSRLCMCAPASVCLYVCLSQQGSVYTCLSVCLSKGLYTSDSSSVCVCLPQQGFVYTLRRVCLLYNYERLAAHTAVCVWLAVCTCQRTHASRLTHKHHQHPQTVALVTTTEPFKGLSLPVCELWQNSRHLGISVTVPNVGGWPTRRCAQDTKDTRDWTLLGLGKSAFKMR